MADFKCEPGKVLSPEESAEYRAYTNQKLRLPDKFDGVVFDASDVRGAVLRCKNKREIEAEKERAEAAKNAPDVAKLEADARAEAAKRGVFVPAETVGVRGMAALEDVGTATAPATERKP